MAPEELRRPVSEELEPIGLRTGSVVAGIRDSERRLVIIPSPRTDKETHFPRFLSSALPGYEHTCFAVFADAGIDQSEDNPIMIILRIGRSVYLVGVVPSDLSKAWVIHIAAYSVAESDYV